MKKLFRILLIVTLMVLGIPPFYITPKIHALTPQYLCTSGGTWSGNIWVLSTANQGTCTGGSTPITSDEQVLNASSGNVTISASTSTADLSMSGYAGILTINSSVTLTDTGAADLQGELSAGSPTTSIIIVEGGVTLDASPTSGTFAPLLELTTANQTLTDSGGYIYPGNLEFNFANGVFTMLGSWINAGSLTFNAITELNYTTNETMTVENGLTLGAATISNASNATIILEGGTWSGNSANRVLYNSLTIQPAVSNVTVATSGQSVYVSTGTLTYTPSTYSVVVSPTSILAIEGSYTLNTNGITWGAIDVFEASTVTLTSNLTATTLQNYLGSTFASFSFAGSYNISVGTLSLSSASVAYSLSLVAGQTLNVTSAMQVLGSALGFTVKSATPSSTAYINYSGPLSSEDIAGGVIFTDITASGTVLNNYFGGTLLRTSNITNKTAANFGGSNVFAY